MKRLNDKLVYAWIIFIFINTFLGRQLYNLIIATGGRTLAVTIIAAFALCCGTYVVRKVKSKNYLRFGFLILIGILACLYLELPEERVHIIKFGFLGFLIINNFVGALWKGIALGITVAVMDESIQSLLPYRVGDFRDIIINLLSFFWGLLFKIR